MALAVVGQPLRRSGRVRNTLESSGFAQKLPVGHVEQCCACLLDVDSAGDDGELLAVLDCCQPLHHFHVSCILMWTEQENSCPQCKRRYSRIGIYGTTGALLRVSRVEERDQNFEEADEGEASDVEDVCCQVCHKPDDESSLLLCDGRGGRCNAAYHYYCVGLSEVPVGDWFCPPCRASQSEVAAARSQAVAEESAGSLKVAAAAPPAKQLAQLPERPRLWSSVKRHVTLLQLDLDEDESEDKASGATGSSSSGPGMNHVEPGPLDSLRRAKASSGTTGSSSSVQGAKRAKLEPPFLPVSIKVEPPDEPDMPHLSLVQPVGSPERPRRARAETQMEQFEAPSKPQTALLEKPRLQQVKEEPLVELRAVKEEPVEPPPRKAARSSSAKAHPGPEAFGGLCNEVPKWISRRGRTIRVDLGGRGMRDAAAVVLAKVVQASLEGLGKASGVVMALDLAGNQLHKAGVAALLAVATGLKMRVVRLDLERNLLDGSAAQWLGRWCEEQVGGPPEQLYLSHNKMGDAGACSLLVSLGRCSSVQKRQPVPLWVEARQNRVRHIESVLDALSASVPLCLALDRSACNPGCCASGAGPRLHLFGIMDQKRDDLELDEEPIKCEVKREQEASMKVKSEEALVKVKREPGVAPAVEPSACAVGHPAVRAAVQPPAPAPAQNGGGASASSSSSSSSSSDDGRGREDGEAGRGRGRGRGGGRGGRARGRAPKALPAPPRVEDSHSWAQSLGAKTFVAPPESDPAPIVPTSTGLWATALARERQARQQAKLQRRLSRLESRISSECLEIALESQQSSQSLDSLEVASQEVALQETTVLPIEDATQPVWHEPPGGALQALEDQVVLPCAPAREENIVPSTLQTGNWPLALEPKKVAVPLPPAREEAPVRALGKTGLSAELKELVLARLHRERRLWLDVDEYERRVRRRCVCDQLCRKAQEKYSQMVPTAAAWAEHLRTAQGYSRTVQWVARKIEEVVAKEAGRQRGR